MARTTASNCSRSSSTVTSVPTFPSTPQRSSTPSAQELLDAPLHDSLLDLEVRHAEPDQAARSLVALEEHDGVAGAAELLRGGQARGARADHRHAAAGLDLRGLRGGRCPPPTPGR